VVGGQTRQEMIDIEEITGYELLTLRGSFWIAVFGNDDTLEFSIIPCIHGIYDTQLPG
jgi:hypothetical protein